MFGKNKNKKNENNSASTSANSQSTLKSWLTGRLGSFLIFSAVGYALYKFEIIKKLTSYFKKAKDSTLNPQQEQTKTN